MSAMMSPALRTLQAARYLSINFNEKGAATGIQLLPHGLKYAEQLKHNWKRSESVPAIQIKEATSNSVADSNYRTSFIHTPQFHENMQRISSLPAVFKFVKKSAGTPALPMPASTSVTPANVQQTQLITDFFINARNGLEKFYSIQRERKIWWMRFAANPSRFFLEPYELLSTANNDDEKSQCSAQSITIKMRLSTCTADVEHITLLPLVDKRDNKTLESKRVLPAVIRSVIELESAASAMLLDGCDHNRADTLLLNRTLAPYQCAVICASSKVSSDLLDLRTHLTNVLQRAGLRTESSHSPEALDERIRSLDSVGLPYILLIDERSLRTGLLQLRNRDTTLTETVHISDIPKYLINIFKC